MRSREASAMFIRSALAVLAATIVAAVVPGAATAGMVPVLTLDQSAGTTAASVPSTGLRLHFKPFGGDSVKDVAIAFPPCFILDVRAEGGLCLTSSTAHPRCRLAAGT